MEAEVNTVINKNSNGLNSNCEILYLNGHSVSLEM